MNDIQHAFPLLNFPSFRCFDILLASLLTNLLINFIKFRHVEIPQFLRTILHLYSPIVIQESPLPHIFLEDLPAGRSHQPLQQLWSRRVSGAVGGALPALRQVLQRLLRRHGPGLRLLPLWRSRWARDVSYVLGREWGSDSLHLQKHNRGWEFWRGWWKRLEES